MTRLNDLWQDLSAVSLKHFFCLSVDMP